MTDFEVRQCDITTLDVEGIVNAANCFLLLGSGVAGAIARAGGAVIQKECDDIGSIPVGGAATTSAGAMPARYVIHAATMGATKETNGEIIATATRAALHEAHWRKMRSVAFPALGTGVGGFPVDECARIMVPVIKAHADPLRRVVFAVMDRPAQEAFEAALAP